MVCFLPCCTKGLHMHTASCPVLLAVQQARYLWLLFDLCV